MHWPAQFTEEIRIRYLKENISFRLVQYCDEVTALYYHHTQSDEMNQNSNNNTRSIVSTSRDGSSAPTIIVLHSHIL